jgi:hypothetical protein
LYVYLHKKSRNATYSYECENRVAVEKGQAMAKNPAESGQSRPLTVNVPKRLGRAGHSALTLQLVLPLASCGFQPGGFGALIRGIRGAAQLFIFVGQEGMRLAGIRLYRRGLFQVREGLVESAVQKEHATEK